MSAHIDRLVNEFDILVSSCRRPAKAWGAQDLEEICIAPIKSPLSYATALHEIGHIRGRFQRSRHLLVRERYAWEWAKRHALVWTSRMERCRTEALDWYEQREGKTAAKPVGPTNNMIGEMDKAIDKDRSRK